MTVASRGAAASLALLTYIVYVRGGRARAFGTEERRASQACEPPKNVTRARSRARLVGSALVERQQTRGAMTAMSWADAAGHRDDRPVLRGST